MTFHTYLLAFKRPTNSLKSNLKDIKTVKSLKKYGELSEKYTNKHISKRGETKYIEKQ